jgi:hypothetical protein
MLARWSVRIQLDMQRTFLTCLSGRRIYLLDWVTRLKVHPVRVLIEWTDFALRLFVRLFLFVLFDSGVSKCLLGTLMNLMKLFHWAEKLGLEFFHSLVLLLIFLHQVCFWLQDFFCVIQSLDNRISFKVMLMFSTRRVTLRLFCHGEIKTQL